MASSSDFDFYLQIAVPVDFHFVPEHALSIVLWAYSLFQFPNVSPYLLPFPDKPCHAYGA